MDQQKDLFGNDSVINLSKGELKTASGSRKVNPCIAAYGLDPEGRKCKGCKNLVRIQGGAKYYYKCLLRKISHSAASDHNSRFPACGKFESDE